MNEMSMDQSAAIVLIRAASTVILCLHRPPADTMLLLVGLLSCLLPPPAVESSSLQLVQILFRHGDRTPSHTFPTDPHRQHWKEGVEMLTKLGALQQFRLGQFLRRRYRDFLPAHYHCNFTHVRSTDNDRAILSAQAQLLGLYPAPVDTDTVMQPGQFPLPQLVPIHTVPKRIDQTLKMTSPCPAYKRLWLEMQQSELWKSLHSKYQPFFDQLKQWTGLEKVGLKRTFQIADPIHTWISHNLTLPSWVTPQVVRRLYEVQNLKQWLRYHSREMQRLRGGPLLKLLLENMRGKVEGDHLQRRRLWYSYSAHDSTVAAVSTALGVYNRIQPPYCACLIVELHKTKDEAHSVRLFYRNDSSRAPWRLTLPGCEFDCPLDRFVQLSSGNLPGDISKECFETDDQSIKISWPFRVHIQPWSWIVTSVLSLVVMVMLCAVYRRYIGTAPSYVKVSTN